MRSAFLTIAALSLLSASAFAGECSIYLPATQTTYIHLGTLSEGAVHFGPSAKHSENTIQAGWISPEGRLLVNRPIAEAPETRRTRDVGYVENGSTILENRITGQKEAFGLIEKDRIFISKKAGYIVFFVNHNAAAPCTDDEKAAAATLIFFYDAFRENDVNTPQPAPQKQKASLPNFS
jgi:hypothetical protein